MFYELLKHKVAYAILIGILAIHVLVFLLVWPDTVAQRIGAVSLAASYFFWGVFAHVRANHITRHIVTEYLLASTLAGVMLLMLTL